MSLNNLNIQTPLNAAMEKVANSSNGSTFEVTPTEADPLDLIQLNDILQQAGQLDEHVELENILAQILLEDQQSAAIDRLTTPLAELTAPAKQNSETDSALAGGFALLPFLIQSLFPEETATNNSQALNFSKLPNATEDGTIDYTQMATKINAASKSLLISLVLANSSNEISHAQSSVMLQEVIGFLNKNSDSAGSVDIFQAFNLWSLNQQPLASETLASQPLDPLNQAFSSAMSGLFDYLQLQLTSYNQENSSGLTSADLAAGTVQVNSEHGVMASPEQQQFMQFIINNSVTATVASDAGSSTVVTNYHNILIQQQLNSAQLIANWLFPPFKAKQDLRLNKTEASTTTARSATSKVSSIVSSSAAVSFSLAELILALKDKSLTSEQIVAIKYALSEQLENEATTTVASLKFRLSEEI